MVEDFHIERRYLVIGPSCRRIRVTLSCLAVCISLIVPIWTCLQVSRANAGGPIASITILDPDTGLATKEVVVNEGSTVKLALLVLDVDGIQRDDFILSYTSLAPEVATVDSKGNVQGIKAGFSTLTISSGGVVATGTITIVSIDSGTLGYEIKGIAQDRARRLYLANTTNHTILLARDIKQTPAVYAGVSGSPGFKNDLRLQSLFKDPSFVALNQATGTMHVSDSSNNVLRNLEPGPNGRVEILAGTGVIGSKDGPAKDATFNNPQGVALDDRGNLWVVDSGNHTIRRINLSTRTVETIAGKAGSSGSSDGKGEAARFNSPIGISFETESLAKQLERELRGDPPPPVTMIVADTGNGLIRRVRENGQVETISTTSPSLPIWSKTKGLASITSAIAPARFTSPTGVAVDPSGNIYVTEANAGRVKTILLSGAVVSAAQSNTITNPKGVVITESGKVVVSGSNRSAQQIIYGIPQIMSITPDRVSVRGGEKITLKGKNFATDTTIVVAGAVVSGINVIDTQTISFTSPTFPSGRTTLTVQSRGGLAQTSLTVDPVPLGELPRGYITTVAGGTTFIGDGSPATTASLASPEAMDMDAAGNLYIVDTQNNRIRKVAARTGIITTVVGTGVYGYWGDGGLATLATLAAPEGIAVDASGNLYVADTGNERIRRVDATTGVIATVAGSGKTGFSGDGGLATEASLFRPSGIALDSAGNLFIADFANRRIRKVDATTRIITTVAGTGQEDFFGDNGLATQAALAFPTDVAVDSGGNLFIADLHRIRKVDAKSGIITTVAGKKEYGNSGDNGLATDATLNVAIGITVDAIGNLFIADNYNHRIRKVDAVTKIISTIAGTGKQGFSGDNGLATKADLAFPYGAIVDAAGNVLLLDRDNNRVRKVDASTTTITTFVGSGMAGSSGDGGAATAASLNFPVGIGLDAFGGLFEVDTESHIVRKVDLKTGIITTVAGNGQAGPYGDGGPATQANLNQPTDIAVDPSGNLYIADTSNQRIRKVDVRTGIITTVAGTDRQNGFSGDGGKATAATLNYPGGIAVDTKSNLYISDAYNLRIRKVDSTTGIITTYAGNGQAAFSGDNGKATEAALNYPAGITVDSSGNLFIADLVNYRIRKVDASSGIITTVAGNGRNDFTGDGGLAKDTALVYPRGITVDIAGNLFISDYDRVFKVAAATGIITTVAGNGESHFGGDNGPATEASVDSLRTALDSEGNLYISDRINHRVRGVRGPSGPDFCTYSITPASRSHSAAAETGSVTVTVAAGCSWTATSKAAWITIISGSSGSGNGTVSYSITPNTGTVSRTGTISIAGKTFTITQEAPAQDTTPRLDITLSKSTYVNGDTLTATEFRIRNPGSAPLAVRIKVYLKVPGFGEFTIIDVGSDASFSLPAGLNHNLGPLPLFTVTSDFPRGSWELDSRLTNPTTGALLSEDINPFVIQ